MLRDTCEQLCFSTVQMCWAAQLLYHWAVQRWEMCTIRSRAESQDKWIV